MEPLPRRSMPDAPHSDLDPLTHPDATSPGATRAPLDELTAGDIDALTDLARFEIEHRRVLSMQALYQRRSRGTG